MRSFTVTSKLLVPPEEFWRALVSGKSSSPLPANSDWPRTIRTSKRTIFFRHYHHTRTVRQLAEGCEVSDEVSFKPWGSPLGTWLKVTQIARFREEHARFASTYGKA